MATSFIYLGLDLGQHQDPSALSAIWKYPENMALPTGPRMQCQAVYRWPLGTLYRKIRLDLARLLERSGWEGAFLAIDETGVGRPVVEEFQLAQLPAQICPIYITAGHAATFDSHQLSFHVPKSELVSTLIAAMDEDRFAFSQGIREAEVILNELRNFRTKITAHQHEVFLAREGQHDDIVLATAMAAWLLRYLQRNAPFEGPVVYESGMVAESDRKQGLYCLPPGMPLTPEERARRAMEEEAAQSAAFAAHWAKWDAEDDAAEQRRGSGDVWRHAPRPASLGRGQDPSWMW
jgi:hypothetical protein